MLCLIAAVLSSSYPLVVDPKGNDSAVGDGRRPLASIQEAVNRLRGDTGVGSRVILVNPGTYELAQPIHIGPEMLASGLKIAAHDPKHAPLIVGSRRISNWKIDSHGWWVAHLPKVSSGEWYFSDLFVNGKRRKRPRFPHAGYSLIADKAPPTPEANGQGFDRFAFATGDVNPTWSNQGDLEVVLFHNWFTTTGRVREINGNTVTLASPTGYADGWADLPKGNRYFVENVKEALGTPGEWYLDRPTGTLTYVPMKGESPSRTEVRAPVVDHLLDVTGAPAGPAKRLSLDHLKFQHTLWNIPPGGRSFPQAEVDLGGAIRFQGAQDCRIVDCEVSQVGEYAVDIGADCHRITVEHCRLTDLGAGGVKIGTTGAAHAASDCKVVNNLIYGGGRRAPAAVGVWIGQSAHNQVVGNTIEDFTYTGVSVGWTWGYGASGAYDNLIQGNRIGKIGQGVLSDMGGIYTLGVSPGTKILDNFIHDVESFSYGGWGIYPDEGSTGLLIEGNLVMRCKSASFHQHYGKDNLVLDNVFAFGREAQIMRTRAEDHRSFTFKNNSILWDTGALLGGNWTGDGFLMDGNTYLHPSGKPYDFAGESLAQWQARGQDLNSRFVGLDDFANVLASAGIRRDSLMYPSWDPSHPKKGFGSDLKPTETLEKWWP